MAKGYPDYFGTPIFPQYGTFDATLTPAGAVNNGNTKTMWELTGKGRIYGGAIRSTVIDNNPEGIFFTITVDDVSHNTDYVGLMVDRGNAHLGSRFIQIRRYNLSDNIFMLEMMGGLIYGVNYKIVLDNRSGGDVTPYGYLYHTRIV